MKITFEGAAQTVTGSQHLLEVNGHRLLIDCGLFQGKRSDTYEHNLHFDFDPRSIDAVLLTHAHIDHSGNLPNLVKMGFSGPIYTTPPTVTLGRYHAAGFCAHPGSGYRLCQQESANAAAKQAWNLSTQREMPSKPSSYTTR